MAVQDFVVMHGGPKAMRLPEHEHAEIQIETHFSPSSLTRGSAPVLPETFRLIPSGKPHVGSWREGSEVIVFLLHTRQLEMASDELLHRGKYELAEEIWGADSVVHSVASVLRKEFLSRTSDSLFLEALRTVLAGHLVRSFGSSSARRAGGRLAPRLLRQVMEMIEENLDAGVSIQELAKHCSMGTHHFTQLFKASTGCSPYKYVLDLRIARAKDLLATTSLTLAEIAYKLGFASQSHFTTTFRQHTQFTPQRYRRSVRPS
ncbi:MAG TPA: AraC family transcriptional regulator [Bryobacteraceae bacterium]